MPSIESFISTYVTGKFPTVVAERVRKGWKQIPKVEKTDPSIVTRVQLRLLCSVVSREKRQSRPHKTRSIH